MIRYNLIGPRRLKPSGAGGKPIFSLVPENPSRILKSFIVPGVTEGQINGVLPKTPSKRGVGLFIGNHLVKSKNREDDIDEENAKVKKGQKYSLSNYSNREVKSED